MVVSPLESGRQQGINLDSDEVVLPLIFDQWVETPQQHSLLKDLWKLGMADLGEFEERVAQISEQFDDPEYEFLFQRLRGRSGNLLLEIRRELKKARPTISIQ